MAQETFNDGEELADVRQTLNGNATDAESRIGDNTTRIDALEDPSRSVVVQNAGAFGPRVEDNGAIVRVTPNALNALTVEPDSTLNLPIGFSAVYVADSANGSIIFTGGAGVTIRTSSDYLAGVNAGGAFRLTKLAANTWEANGALPILATAVSYDNSTSGLTAIDAQGAIDEIVTSPAPHFRGYLTASSYVQNDLMSLTEIQKVGSILFNGTTQLTIQETGSYTLNVNFYGTHGSSAADARLPIRITVNGVSSAELVYQRFSTSPSFLFGGCSSLTLRLNAGDLLRFVCRAGNTITVDTDTGRTQVCVTKVGP